MAKARLCRLLLQGRKNYLKWWFSSLDVKIDSLHSIGTTPSEFWGNSLIPRDAADDEKDNENVIQDSWNKAMGALTNPKS